DDSPLVCALAEEVLGPSGAGYEVHRFTDPSEALLRLPELSPAVVVCDLNMPGLSGVEVVAQVRGMLPDVPVVIYTESNTVGAAEAVMHANPMLVKLLGYASADELRGTPLISLFHPDEREAVIRSMQEAAAAGAPVRPGHERRWIGKNGKSPLVEVSTIPVLW